MPDPVITSPETVPVSPPEHSRQQLEALLEVSEAIAQQRDLPALFHDLAGRLHSVVDFDFLTLTCTIRAQRHALAHPRDPHPARKTHRRGSSGGRAPSDGSGNRRKPSLSATPARKPAIQNSCSACETKAWFLRADAAHHSAAPAGRHGIRPSDPPAHYRRRAAIHEARRVSGRSGCRQRLNLESSQAYQTSLLTNATVFAFYSTSTTFCSQPRAPELFRGIVSTLQRVIHHDYTSLALLDPGSGTLKIYALDFPGRRAC